MSGVPVTVLMPVFNGAAHLRAAVDSILAQTHRDFELLVVDDGSTDASPQILDSYRDARLRIERFERNRGLSAALNRGLELAAAPLVARQDADDVAREDRLATQLAYFRASAGVVLTGSQARSLNERGDVIGNVNRPLDPLSIQWYALVDNPFIHTSVMFQRSVAIGCGGYDAAFDPYSQDHALWWRMMQRGAVHNHADRLVDYRVNAASIIGRTEASEDSAYRSRFEQIVGDIVSRHALEAFGSRGLTPQDARLLAGFVAGIDADTLDRFLDVFARMLSWYEAAHPEATSREDFAHTLARQYDAIAYRVRPASRRSSARVYAHAISRRPGLVTALSWPRLIAMIVFGLQGRARLARTWSGAGPGA
jgi:glycosyltransferase involved in cell wall biosynthesis